MIDRLLAASLPFRGHKPGALFILAGSLLYLVGTMFVTCAFNVPLNDTLATVEPASADGASRSPDGCGIFHRGLLFRPMDERSVANPFLFSADRFHKFLQCPTNLTRGIFLQEMQALDGDFGLVRPGPAGFQYATPDDGSGFAHDEELGQRTLRHRFPILLDDLCNIGRLTLDGDLTRPNQGR